MFMKIHLITVVFAFYNIRIIKTTEMRFTLSWFRLWEKGCWFIYVVCRKFLRVGIDPRTLIYSLVSLLALSPRYGIFNLMVNTSLKKPSFVADHLTNVSKLLQLRLYHLTILHHFQKLSSSDKDHQQVSQRNVVVKCMTA